MLSKAVMRTFWVALATFGVAHANSTDTLSSHQILPDSFKPPQVFKNTNLLRTINLEKGYVQETVNVVIENVDKESQSTYYLPFDGATIGKVGGLQVRDKKAPQQPPFTSETVEYDPHSPTQFFRIILPVPLAPKGQQTLSISYNIISTFEPLPAKINQQDKQYLVYKFSLYAPSAYPTDNQKTKVKFSTVDIPDYSGEPERQGTTFTYGPYTKKPAGVEEEAIVRYEFTKPLVHATLLERDIEISHWGGNLAAEERYWLTNQGAELSTQFSRLQWALTSHYPAPSTALKELKFPLQVGSVDPYYVDDIGNVSTSNFRSGSRDAHLELKPRYPVFGGWNYSFKIGWNSDLNNFLRYLKSTDGYVLKAPFLEGPKLGEGISYDKVQLRFILPEGATNIKYECPVPLVSEEVLVHRGFMDTVGRTTLTLTAMNMVDQMRDQNVVVTYDYSMMAALRKPLTVIAGCMAVFLSWTLGNLDVSIGKAK